MSRTLSVIAHPLWMPTYGILLFCAALTAQHGALPSVYWIITTLGTLTLTALIPLSVIIIELIRGSISSLEIRKAEERTSVYVYTIVCYAFWCYFILRVLHAPIVLFLIGIGATLALIGVTIINRHWKISAHLTGIGGLIGGVCAYCLANAQMLPIGLITILLAVALLLSYARIYINAHTPLQVIAGLLFGLIITFLPSLCLSCL